MNNFKSNTTMLGICEVDITPITPVETVGFGRQDELSRGILHPLSAQISIWKFNNILSCVISIDHIGFSAENANFLRDKIADILLVSRECVMLCFSHTHSAPNDSIEKEYFNFICSQIETGIIRAKRDFSPVNAAWGNSYSDIGVNRLSDINQPDKRIGILKVTNVLDGSLKMIALRLTAHANVLKSDNYLISPDYFGCVRDILKERYKCMIMLSQGASGNIAPKYYKSSIMPPDVNFSDRFINSETALTDIACKIYLSVDAVLDNIKSKNISNMKIYSIYHDFYADVPSLDCAVKISNEALKYAGIDGHDWLNEVKRLHQSNVICQKETVEIQYFEINNGCFCGVPNEIMSEFAIATKNILDNENFYLGGYTNGCTGYFPTEEEYDKGGYEVYWSMLIYYIYHGRVFPLNRNSASELIEDVIKNYRQ